MRRVLVLLALAGAVLVAASWMARRSFATGDLAPPRVEAHPRERAPRLDDFGGGVPTRDSVVSEVDVVEPAAPPRAPESHARARLEALCADEAGAPLAGVEAWIANAEGVTSAWSGADGRVALELGLPFEPRSDPALPTLLQTASVLDVRFRASGRATLARRVPPAEGTTVLGRIALPPGGALVGRVVDARGAPVAHALVWAAVPQSEGVGSFPRPRPDGVPGGGIAATDGAGRYGLEGLFAGEVALACLPPGGRPASRSPVRVEAGATRVAPDLVLAEVDPATSIRGFARGPDGTPVEGAWIHAMRDEDGIRELPGVLARSAADGSFALATGEGPHRLSARAPRDDDDWVARELEGVPSGARIEIAFRELPRIEVSAATEDGFACDDWRLMVLPGEGARIEPRGAGQWHVHAPPPFTLAVVLPGMTTAEAGPFLPSRVPPEHHFVVDAPSLLRGRVLADGRPVSGARVHVHRTLPLFERRGADADELAERLQPAIEGATTTRADGRFAIPVSAASDRFLHVEHPGFARAEAGPFQVAGPPFDVELRPGGRIAGELLLPGGMSPAGSVLAAQRGDAHAETALVAGDGRFAFDHLAPGAWVLHRVEGERRPDRPIGGPALGPLVEVREGETALAVLDLRADAARLAVSAAVAGEPLAHWTFDVTGAAHPARGTLDAAGRFETLVDHAGHGSIRLGSSPFGCPQRRALTLELDVAPGLHEADVDLEAGTLFVDGLALPRTPDSARLQSASAPVLLAQQSEPGRAFDVVVLAAPPGPLRLDRMPAGEWRLEWRENGWKGAAQVESVSVEPGATARVSFAP